MKSIRAAVVAVLAMSLVVVAPVVSPAQASDSPTGSSDADAGAGDDVGRGEITPGTVTNPDWSWPVCDNKGGTVDPNWNNRPRGERQSPVCKGPGQRDPDRFEAEWVKLCVTAFEVYRYYGTLENPASSATMSKANLKQACKANAKTRLFYPNPTDAKSPNSAGFSAMGMAKAGSPYYLSVSEATKGGPGFYPRDNRTVALSHGNVPTTVDPFAALGPTCSVMANSITVGRVENWFGTSSESTYREDLQRIMHEAYMNGYQSMRQSGYSRTLADRYARGWAYIAERAGNPPVGAMRTRADIDPDVDYPYPRVNRVLEVPPISSPDQIVSTGERGACKSPFEFARVSLQPVEDLDPATVPAIGTCVASLVTPGNVIVARDWEPTGQLEQWVANYFPGVGADYYGPKPKLASALASNPISTRAGSLTSTGASSEAKAGLQRKNFEREYTKAAKTLRKELPAPPTDPFKEQIGGIAPMFDGGSAMPSKAEFKAHAFWFQPWVNKFPEATKMDNIIAALERSLVCDSMVLVLNLCTPDSPDWDPVTKTCVKCSPENPDYNPATGQCEPDQRVTVTYDGNGATAGLPPVDPKSPYKRNAVVRVLPKPADLVKDGHVFENWNTERDGSGQSFDAGRTFRIRANVTLYAQWEPVEVQVECNPSSPDWNSARGDCAENPDPTQDPTPGGWHMRMNLAADEVFHVGGKEALHTVSVMGGMSNAYKTLMCSASRPCGSDEMDPYLLYMQTINLDVVAESSPGVAQYKECANSRERGCQFGQEGVAPARWTGYFFSPTVEGQWLRPSAQVVAMVQTKVKKKYPIPCPVNEDGTGGGICGYREEIEDGPIVPVGAHQWVVPNNPVSPTSPRWRVIGSTGRAG